jgi:SAM-dependent methyltransferase
MPDILSSLGASSEYEAYSFIADLYDHDVGHRKRPDVAFFVDAAKQTGGPVLEIGCGTGRVLIPTAREGVAMVGIDLSPYMLAVCRQRAAEESEATQQRIRVIQADMRDFSLGEQFALVTMPFRPFQHMLTVEDQLACLTQVHRHLVDDGVLILDLFNPSLDALVRPPGAVHQDEGFVTPDGRQVTCSTRIVARDRANQVNHVELIYDVTHPDGRTERLVHAFPMRYLFRFEAEHLLARSGFEVVQLYAGYDRSEYGSTYPGELLFVARRK